MPLQQCIDKKMEALPLIEILFNYLEGIVHGLLEDIGMNPCVPSPQESENETTKCLWLAKPTGYVDCVPPRKGLIVET